MQEGQAASNEQERVAQLAQVHALGAVAAVLQHVVAHLQELKNAFEGSAGSTPGLQGRT